MLEIVDVPLALEDRSLGGQVSDGFQNSPSRMISKRLFLP